MLAQIRAITALLVVTLLLCSIGYPLVLLGVGQGLFPGTANGSLIEHQGRTIGSRLIAQPSKGDEWFQPRPSAVDYNAGASGGSNLAASNPALRKRVEEQLDQWEKKASPASAGATAIPSDAVLASGSGLDPHITLANARLQSPRVASEWARKTGRPVEEVNTLVTRVLDESAFRPLGGLAGQELLINVLEVNRQLSVRLER